MNTPHTSHQPTTESAPTGHTDTNKVTAYRYWRISNGQLFAPLAGDPLPHTGTLHADCHRSHLPPHPACRCGISIYLSAEDVQRAVNPLDPAQFVITTGTAHHPIIEDTVSQLYTYAGTPRPGPPSYRCRAYTAHTIYTDTTHDNELPIETLSRLR